jgi:hypothetical protein
MTRRIYCVCFLILSCLVTTLLTAFSEIRIIHSLDEIPIDAFSKTTLVMLDIDDVLIYPKDALLQNWRSEWKPEKIREWTSEEDTIAWMNAKFQIMDSFGPEFIKQLNEIGVPTIGFTSFAMDQSDIVKSVPDWRHKHLVELGLNFKMQKEIIFDTENGCIPPSFENGVLYCGDFYKKDKDSKGKVLSIFLDWLDWRPEQVILVDDGQHNIDSVKNELEKYDIPFLGFLYTPKDLDFLDEQVAEFQYETIINKKLWLSDEEAKQLIEASKQCPFKNKGDLIIDLFRNLQ